MAEAHAAVAFSFVVTQEGLDFNVNREALKAVWRSGFRSWKKNIARFKNHCLNNIFPFRPSSWLVVIVLLFALSVAGWDFSRYGVSSIEWCLNEYLGIERHLHIVACTIFSFLLWLTGVLLARYTLWILFSYTRWMYEPFGKPSTLTKIWHTGVKFLSGRSPRLYSYQSSLPKLPVPSLDDTINRYLRSVRPLMTDQEYTETSVIANDFKKTLGSKLQFYLILKSWWATNYCSDWWEDYVYLHGRGPIMVNSNFYGLDTLKPLLQQTQAARAANMVYHMLVHMRKIDREDLRPAFVNNLVPLCSVQYERQFTTTRVPGEVRDTSMHWRDCYHIAVMHAGKFYKVYFNYNHVRMTPVELEKQFTKILEDKSAPCDGEEHLGALTAAERIPWARARKEFFSSGVNKSSLDAIEKAAFVLAFDDEEYFHDPKDPSKMDAFARSMLHGKGHDRWFDKSINLVVSKNGRVGFNCEHSWADAAVTAHLWEYCLGKDGLAAMNPDDICGYTAEGNCVGKVRGTVPNPIRLKFEIPEECKTVISTSLASATALISDVDLHIFIHDQFGKGAMKKCRVSPDAFIQMALQLAYFREAGKFCLTYEAAMTRGFKDGRTETIRSCSIESADFVKTMENPNKTQKEKVAALKLAGERHTMTTRDALCGKGLDRHLFCLYVVSKYIGVDTPFLQKVLSEPWRLSTSQTPTRQTDLIDMSAKPEFISAGGGFGPVADDGYGVSYIIIGEDIIFFHVSCKISCGSTDSKRFAQVINKAMADILALFDTPSQK